MSGINCVVLAGRTTKDIEVKKSKSGLSVAQFTVAIDRPKQGDGPSADFINCVAWRQSADYLGQYAKKGTMVGVVGKIQTRNYDNAQGQRVYVTEVIADNVSILARNSDNKKDEGNPLPTVPVAETAQEKPSWAIDEGDLPF